MRYAVLDVESTIKNKGHPFTKTNKLCAVGVKDKEGLTVYDIEYGDEPYGAKLQDIKRRLEAADYVVGFNIKFDLHWLRRYIDDLRIRAVFDCQLLEFMQHGQADSYPSLEGALEHRALPPKLDRVAVEYWSNGIDTTGVPWDLLSEYCAGDVERTDQLHLLQKAELQGNMRKLFFLQCEDLLLLEEMEWNGLKYDLAKASAIGQELQEEAAKIDAELRELVGHPCVDLGSSDHISSVLYGGTIWEQYREQYTRELKDGTQKQKERWARRPVEFKRLVKPLSRTEIKPTNGISDKELTEINRRRNDEGKVPYSRHYSVSEPVLSKLAARGRAKRIIELILLKSRNHKLNSTYYGGLIEKHQTMEWEPDTLHGQFNQCVARTGRLSSSEPNSQNFDKSIKELFYSRYED